MKLKRKVREARINKREAKSKDPQAGAGDIRAKLSGARKKIFISVLGCAVILCAFVGIGRNLPKQDPIELETVSDEAPAEERCV